jgi:FkbM family methyltransferase
VDVGANIGIFCLPLAASLPNAKVIAVEPHPVACAALLRNVRSNELGNVTVVSAAITDSPGLVRLFNCPTNSGGHRLSGFSGRRDLEGREVYSVVVPGITLAQLFAECSVNHCDILKIDTEGHEVSVLKSLGDALTPFRNGRGIQAVIAEFGPEGLRAAGSNGDELISLMDGHGFKCEVIQTGQAISAPEDLPSLKDFEVADLLFAPKEA